MRYQLNLIVFLAFLFIKLISFASAEDGHLFIIGGGDRPEYMMKKFLNLAGNDNARVVIIPLASTDPLDTALHQRYEFENLGAGKVDFILPDSADMDRETNLHLITKADCIFFSGGDQNRLTAALLHTKLLKEIRALYHRGGTIGGTSAGAAVMSKVMITGDELRNPDSTQSFIHIRENNIKISEGFGFLTTAIIDQHFVRRKRHNRLISLVLENPQLIGVAIDESTALLVYPDKIFEVIGENTVLIYDASSARYIGTDKNTNLYGQDLKLHILKSGDRYDLNSRKILQ